MRIQTVVTSPPYWGMRDYGVDGQIGLEASLAEYVAALVHVLGLVRVLLSDDGTLWLNLGDAYATSHQGGSQGATGQRAGRQFTAPTYIRNRAAAAGVKRKDLLGVPWRVAFELQEQGWYLRQEIIWHKPNPTPESAKDRFIRSHEQVFLLSKCEHYHFDADAVAEPSVGGLAGVAEDPCGGQRPTASLFGASVRGHLDSARALAMLQQVTRRRRSVWTIPTARGDSEHHATFPAALVELCVLAGSRPGDIVFDPFMGLGTVAQVAQRLGRRWLGCEINERYIARQRGRTAQAGLELTIPRSA